MRRVAGGHAPNTKNRSSKHLSLLIGTRSVYRSMNHAMLDTLDRKGDSKASKEIIRRQKKAEKRAKTK